MLVYRIGHKNYIGSLSASGADGRWASEGRKVIYCAESLALAFLENMVKRQGVGFNSDFRIVVIEIPDTLAIETIDAGSLKNGWRDPRDYGICQQHGNKWYNEAKRPVLKVPSAILTDSNNYVIKALHKDFNNVRIVSVSDLVPDERIEDILKRSR